MGSPLGIGSVPMKSVKMYTKDYCPYCNHAKRLLQNKGVVFEEIDMTHRLDELEDLKKKTGWRTVPMIFIGDRLVGGYTDLKELEDSGELDQLISSI